MNARTDGAVDQDWVGQDERDGGRGDGGLATLEREERRSATGCGAENRQLRVERETLSKAAAWLPSEDEHDSTEGFRFVSKNRPHIHVELGNNADISQRAKTAEKQKPRSRVRVIRSPVAKTD